MQKETITTVLSRADHGQLLDDANAKLAELSRAVLDNEGKGKIVLTINVSKVKGKDALEVLTDMKADIPGPPRDADLYFANDEGQVSRKDPRQPDLPETNIEQIRK